MVNYRVVGKTILNEEFAVYAERLLKVFIPFLVAGAMLAGHCHAAMAFRNVAEGQTPLILP